MMKKEYMVPTIEVVEFASEILMNITSGETTSTGTGNDDELVGDETPDLVGRRRGSWGDLWGNEE